MMFTRRHTRSLFTAALAIGPALAATPAVAPAQVRASERASVSQVIDGTRITVDYSRPVARGRADLFGGVVQWGEVWTPGANAATVLELSDDVRIDGHPVPAGRWSVWMAVAEAGAWELVLDPRDDLFHTEHPEPADDQIRFEVVPGEGRNVEVLTWSFPRVRRDGATLVMTWGTTEVALEIDVEPTPIPAIAAEDAASYVGAWEIQYVEPSGDASPPFAFDIRYEEGGRLLGRMPWDSEEPSDFLLIPRAEGIFLPALLRDGEVFDVETAVLLEFQGADENGTAAEFLGRTDKDEIWLRGRRAAAEPLAPAVDIEPAELVRFAGRYGDADTFQARVTLDDGRLVMQLPRMGRVGLVPIGPGTFRLEGAWAPVRSTAEFEVEGDRATQLTVHIPWDRPAVRLARAEDEPADADDGAGNEAGTDEAAVEPTPEWQIATAVLALPEPLRAGAEVRAWTDDGHLRTIREGSNRMVCLADRPGDGRFAAACYHDSLEPFMERGRELNRQGIEGVRRTETRWEEIRAGTLPMPAAAMVYNLWFPSEDLDPGTLDPGSGMRLHALYARDLTAEETGLSAVPGDGAWLMEAGTPSAHVMIAVPAAQD